MNPYSHSKDYSLAGRFATAGSRWGGLFLCGYKFCQLSEWRSFHRLISLHWQA